MKQKIRIAHLIARMVTGGAEENTALTVIGLNKEKYCIDLIVGDDFREDIFSDQKKKDLIRIIRIKGFKGQLNIFLDLLVFIKLILIFSKNRYHILHTHTTKAGILGRIAGNIARIPILICGLHGSAFNAFDSSFLNHLLIFLERISGRFTDAYISVSQNLSEKYQKEGIGQNSKYFTVLSGMNLERFKDIKNKIKRDQILQELGIDVDAFVVGTVGRLEKVKGQRYLIDALDRVKKSHPGEKVVLLVLGEGEEKRNLMEYAIRKDLKENVVFAGFRKDIEKIMGIMDIFALSSLREGLPRVLVQASAAGLPCIAFNVDGVSEIVRDGQNGYLVEVGQIQQLAEKITDYIKNPGLVTLHGENGKKFVEGQWSVQDMVEKTDQIYQMMIEQKLRIKKS